MVEPYQPIDIIDYLWRDIYPGEGLDRRKVKLSDYTVNSTSSGLAWCQPDAYRRQKGYMCNFLDTQMRLSEAWLLCT